MKNEPFDEHIFLLHHQLLLHENHKYIYLIVQHLHLLSKVRVFSFSVSWTATYSLRDFSCDIIEFKRNKMTYKPG